MKSTLQLANSVNPRHVRISEIPDAATCDSWHGKRVLVMGLGRFGGGVAVARWLVGQGACVTVSDSAPAVSLDDSIAKLAECRIRYRLGGHDLADLDHTDFVVVNPAVVKRKSAFFSEVERRGIPWTTEINIFCHRCVGTVIGVTGSFGKSTTCAMIAAVLDAWTEATTNLTNRVFLGGNIGRSLLPEIPMLRPESFVVLELSNAQLEDLPRISWSPHVAAITNIRPHHLDRYEDFNQYVHAKLNITADSSQTRRVYYGDLAPAAQATMDRITNERAISARHVTAPMPPLELRVPGVHNLRNASMAHAICRFFDIDDSLIRNALLTFQGLPHRLEFVRTVAGTDYINDSKCTSLSALAASIEAIGRTCILIAGGQCTSQVFDDRVESAVKNHCRHVIVVGETADLWKDKLDAHRQRTEGAADGGISTGFSRVASLEIAVEVARSTARAGDAILFAPGAPSFDRYSNYEQRGDHFRSIVMR